MKKALLFPHEMTPAWRLKFKSVEQRYRLACLHRDRVKGTREWLERHREVEKIGKELSQIRREAQPLKEGVG